MEPGSWGSRGRQPCRDGADECGSTEESGKLSGAALGVGVIGQKARKEAVAGKKGLGDPWYVLWWAEKTVTPAV